MQRYMIKFGNMQVVDRVPQKSKGHATCDSWEGGASSYGQELQVIL